MTATSQRGMSRQPGRWLGLALTIVAACTFASGPIWAQSGYATQAKQAILIDANDGSVLFQHNADERMHPASMSKLMTLVMVFRALKSGQLKMDDEFVMSVNAWRTGGAPSGTSAMFVPVNEKVTVSELLQGIIVQSGNDASICVAENIAGTEEAFAEQMTRFGREIGLKSTTFKNSTGLYHPEHLTTARDLARLAQYVINEFPEYYPMFAQPDFRYRRHRFVNRNPLLNMDLGVDGLKTGYIKEGGYGMVASAKQGERRLIAVVNGLPTAAKRREEAARLLEWGFRNFTEFRLFDEGEIVGRARVWGGDQFYLPLTGAEGGVQVLLPRSAANQRLKAEIIYNSPLKPPIRKGDPVAKLRVTTAMNTMSEVPLYAAEDVDRAGPMRRGLDTLAYMAFRWIP